MKKIILKAFVLLIVCVAFNSCIKKDAIKYDPELVGTWVTNDDSTGNFAWLLINADGTGAFVTTQNGEEAAGTVKYSIFERKLWIGLEKFKVLEWHTGALGGPSGIQSREYKSNAKKMYTVDKRMVIKPRLFGDGVTLFRIVEGS
jgi:hypothetical protein